MYKFVIGGSNNMETALYKTTKDEFITLATTPYILDPDQDRYIYGTLTCVFNIGNPT